MNDNKHMSKYGIGRHIRLDPPKAQIVGVLFQADDKDGVVRPFYSVLMGGQRIDGVREDDIIGIDYREEERLKEIERQASAGRAASPKVTPISREVAGVMDAVPGGDDQGEEAMPGDATFGKFGEPMPGVAEAEADPGFETRS